jgi:hypothetical protein
MKEKATDCDAAVATDDRYSDLRSQRDVVQNLGNEGAGSDDVQGGYTEEAAGIELIKWATSCHEVLSYRLGS